MNWALIIFIYAGVFSSGDNVTISNVDGFTSETSCKKAGELSLNLVSGTKKNVRYICVLK